MTRKLKSIPINWEANAYSLLKDFDATILGMFCEFIDNSIQSYRDDKNKIRKHEPNFILEIDLNYDGNEIIIKDNAGGIDTNSFERAMKPANKPGNRKGFNEFGIGMKYAAVWVSNEWTLKSKSYKENIERTVTFDYFKVIDNNLKSLVPVEKEINDRTHGTTIILRKLEEKHVMRWQEAYIKRKLASIYRNFLRTGENFLKEYQENPIIIRYNGEKLKFKEYGFLNAPWWKSIQIDENQNSEKIEWKLKFPWKKIKIGDKEFNKETGEIIAINKTIEVSGFIGILPDGDHKNKNGFTFFRRGRIIEGIDSRIHPISISTASSRSFKYIRLYGEIHFRNVEVSYNKSSLTIDSESRNDIFSILALEANKFSYEGDVFDLLQQADKHRASYKITDAKNAIESRKNKAKKNIEIPQIFKKEQKKLEEIRAIKLDENYEKSITEINNNKFKKILETENPKEKIIIGTIPYNLKINYFDSEDLSALYTLEKNESQEGNNLNIGINLKHHIFIEYPENIKDETKFNMIIEFVKCLVKSEIKATNGLNKARTVRDAFNLYASTLKL